MYLYSIKHLPTGLYHKQHITKLSAVKCILTHLQNEEDRRIKNGFYDRCPDYPHFNREDYLVEQYELVLVGSQKADTL